MSVLIKVLTVFVVITCEVSQIQSQDGSWTHVLDLPEGAKCQYRKYNGTCVNARQCLSIHITGSYTANEIPAICNLIGSEKIICCPDCKTIKDISEITYIDGIGIFQRKAGRIADTKCLEYLEKLPYECKSDFITDLIHLYSWNSVKKCANLYTISHQYEIFGENAKRDEFPFMALLGYGDNEETAEYLCGGSVISERYILTAAHCISSPLLGPVKYIALGILKRSDPPSLWRRYTVKTIIPHPQYKSPSKYHDIALLETSTEITFDVSVLPACLNTKEHKTYPDPDFEYRNEDQSWRGESGYATGWGKKGEKGEVADVLQKIYITRYNDSECAKLYPPFRHMVNGYDNVTQVCYGDRNKNADTCSGDSGGPVQFTISANVKSCQFSIYAIVSGGNPCGMKGGAGLYTRIDSYLDWIESVVWK